MTCQMLSYIYMHMNGIKNNPTLELYMAAHLGPSVELLPALLAGPEPAFFWAADLGPAKRQGVGHMYQQVLILWASMTWRAIDCIEEDQPVFACGCSAVCWPAPVRPVCTVLAPAAGLTSRQGEGELQTNCCVFDSLVVVGEV